MAPTHQDRINLNQVGRAGELVALAANHFSVPEYQTLTRLAEKRGYRTLMVSPQRSLVSGRSDKGEEMNFAVNCAAGDLSVKTIDGAIIPGGANSVSTLKEDQDTRLLIHDLLKAGKPIFASGEAVELLTEIAGIEDQSGDAAVALSGEVFTGSGDDAQAKALSAFSDALGLESEAA